MPDPGFLAQFLWSHMPRLARYMADNGWFGMPDLTEGRLPTQADQELQRGADRAESRLRALDSSAESKPPNGHAGAVANAALRKMIQANGAWIESGQVVLDDEHYFRDAYHAAVREYREVVLALPKAERGKHDGFSRTMSTAIEGEIERWRRLEKECKENPDTIPHPPEPHLTLATEYRRFFGYVFPPTEVERQNLERIREIAGSIVSGESGSHPGEDPTASLRGLYVKFRHRTSLAEVLDRFIRRVEGEKNRGGTWTEVFMHEDLVMDAYDLLVIEIAHILSMQPAPDTSVSLRPKGAL